MMYLEHASPPCPVGRVEFRCEDMQHGRTRSADTIEALMVCLHGARMVPEVAKKYFPEVRVLLCDPEQVALKALPAPCTLGSCLLLSCSVAFVQMALGFQDPRVRVEITDGIKWVEAAAEGTYDAIIVDSSDPVGPAEVLFQKVCAMLC